MRYIRYDYYVIERRDEAKHGAIFFGMFDILFGWRKASECKKLIRCVQCRLKLLKNKRCVIIRQSREDVAQLLKNGQDQSAFARVEQLFNDQSIMVVYDLLEHFCEFIIIHLPYIRRHKDCPNDVNEAVSSLIFSAARCGDLPELQRLRKLFGDRYGHKFAKVAGQLLPGNLVNRQISEKLCIKSIPDDVKLRLVDETARDYRFQLRPLRSEDRFELQHHQVYGNIDCQWKGQFFERVNQVNYSSTEGAQMQASNVKEIQWKGRSIGSLSNCKKLVVGSCQSPKCLDIASTCTEELFVFQLAPIIAEPHSSTLTPKSAAKIENYYHLDPLYEHGIIPYRSSGQSNLESRCKDEVETITEIASESSLQFSERSIVYLDDIEEFQSPTLENDDSKDQRLFLFKFSILPLIENFGVGRASLLNLYHDGCDEDHTEHYKLCDGRACSQSSSKRRKWRYDFCHCRYSPEEEPLESTATTNYISYGRATDNKATSNNTRDQEVDWESPPKKLRRRNFQNSSILYDAMASQNHRHGNQCMKTGEVEELSDCPASCGSSHGSCSRISSPHTNTGTHRSDLRSTTMPPEWPKDTPTGNILRSSSCQFRKPNHPSSGSSSSLSHVHPKLPDYDDLSAKFLALKKEYLQSKHWHSRTS